jgi:hypothetical protein
MTQLIWEADEEYTRNELHHRWTTSRLADEFFLDLTKTKREIKIIDGAGVTNNSIHYKKYYRQAISKMYRIPLTEQHPKSGKEAVPFVINFSDLSPKVQSEFREYCKQNNKTQITIFLKQVVIRLFQNLDFAYTHMSVLRKLRVVLH